MKFKSRKYSPENIFFISPSQREGHHKVSFLRWMQNVELRFTTSVEGVGEQEITIKYRFFEAKELKKGAEGASVSSDTRRLCDASGPFKSHPAKKRRTPIGVSFVWLQ